MSQKWEADLRLFMKQSFNKIVDQSLEKGDLTQEHVEWLISLPIETAEQQDRAYEDLIRFHVETRLIKGAAYLEKPNLTPEQRKKGTQLYNDLCKELEQLQVKLSA